MRDGKVGTGKGCCCAGCCCRNNQIDPAYTTQEACEDCTSTSTCFEEIFLDNQDQPCPDGWFGSGGFCSRIRTVESCAECSGFCENSTTGPCGKWINSGCDSGPCTSGEHYCDCQCKQTPCQDFYLSGTATNCRGQTCQWGPRIATPGACAPDEDGLMAFALLAVPIGDCGPQDADGGSECWPCPGGSTSCDEQDPQIITMFGALILVYARVTCTCDYFESAVFDSYIIQNATRFASATCTITQGPCE